MARAIDYPKVPDFTFEKVWRKWRATPDYINAVNHLTVSQIGLVNFEEVLKLVFVVGMNAALDELGRTYPKVFDEMRRANSPDAEPA